MTFPFETPEFAGLSPQTAQLVTVGIQRFFGQRQPRKFFGNNLYAAL
jgi:hypothetical protein